jgi:pantoate kinase
LTTIPSSSKTYPSQVTPQTRFAMGTASAFAPGHLTGLFQICDQPSDPLLKGARGSGISLDLGVYTTVTASDAETMSWSIKINGFDTQGAFVSENVLRRFSSRISPKAITVEHWVETPIEAGFGASGGGALSLSLALNEVTGANFKRLETAQLAHAAEIECKTGLGSVFAALRGGFGVLTKPGAPGIGEAISYPDPSEFRVIYLHFGPISTKEALANPALRAKINEMGGKFVNMLQRKPTTERFMRLSRQFTEHVGLVTPKLRALFNKMDLAGYPFTMAMFGEVGFSIMEKERAEEAAKLLESSFPGYEAIVVGIDREGAKVISKNF